MRRKQRCGGSVALRDADGCASSRGASDLVGSWRPGLIHPAGKLLCSTRAFSAGTDAGSGPHDAVPLPDGHGATMSAVVDASRTNGPGFGIQLNHEPADQVERCREPLGVAVRQEHNVARGVLQGRRHGRAWRVRVPAAGRERAGHGAAGELRVQGATEAASGARQPRRPAGDGVVLHRGGVPDAGRGRRAVHAAQARGAPRFEHALRGHDPGVAVPGEGWLVLVRPDLAAAAAGGGAA
mmetsp:Transcript_41145/g.97488  ORF Transcript_41145/g.97488 Transcript_41145/m.97488 type:complete len:239 (-) Transcript_41145:2658-3374(-)